MTNLEIILLVVLCGILFSYLLFSYCSRPSYPAPAYTEEEYAEYAEHVKSLSLPVEGWERVKLRNGKVITLARTNLKDSEYAISGGDEHFTQRNAIKAAKKYKYRLFTKKEFILFSQFLSVWDDEREGRWFRCAAPDGKWVDIFLPASGSRGRTSGAFYYVGANGYSWSASVSGTNGFFLYFNSTYVYPQYSYSRALGLPVRCIAA